MKRKVELLAATFITVLFAACGDDDDSGVNLSNEKVEVVSSISNLGDCTEALEGDTVFVKDKKADYICLDGEWERSDEDSSEAKKDASEVKKDSSKVKQDSSDVKKDSSDAKKDTSEVKKDSSEAKQDTSEVKKDSSETKKDTSEVKQDSTARDSVPTAVVKDKSISGVSQKGPFVNGSSVTVQEVDGKTLAQTGKSFKGKISNDKGEFSISSVTLASQYALLEANGYFQNEYTGKKSNGTITLNALADLSDRKNVNINLLTHLEYERALYLVGQGLSVSAAKKQAETEVFAAFGIKGDFASSEDLNIFSEGDGNAALLAISVIMLGKRSEAELTELLTNFATDIEKDGKWDDSALMAKIADDVAEYDLKGGKALSAIRKNIEAWKMGDVPSFEKYVRDFWNATYGIGKCAKDKEGNVVAVKNEQSSLYGTKDRLICKNEKWLLAEDIEKDTYQWTAGEDGEIKIGDVTKTQYYDYDKSIDAWRYATQIEAALGGCIEANENDLSHGIGKVGETWYMCKNREWVSSSVDVVDTLGWNVGDDGNLKKGNVTDIIYKYDEGESRWLKATKNDTTLGLGVCLSSRAGELAEGSDGMRYVCQNLEWTLAPMMLWDGSKGEWRVPVENPSGGYWFSFDDYGSGGASEITWKVNLGDGGDMTPVVEACGGLCGSFVLNQGTSVNKPFVAFAFYFGKSDKYVTDLSVYDGLCVEYTASSGMAVKIGLTNTREAQTGYAIPEYALVATSEKRVVNIPWFSFEQPDWGLVHITGLAAAKEAASIKFFIEGEDGDSGTFSVTKVGSMGTCK